jgi:hypothetical protein
MSPRSAAALAPGRTTPVRPVAGRRVVAPPDSLPPEPRALRAVSPPRTGRRPARAPFVLLVCGLLVGGLLLVLLINTWLAQGSFEARQLQQQQVSLQISAQALQQELAAQSAPGNLAAVAAAMGMVPAPAPVFKDAAGNVLGVPEKAVAPPPPPAPSPSASASASVSPSASASVPPSASASASASASTSASASRSATHAAAPTSAPSAKTHPSATAAPPAAKSP